MPTVFVLNGPNLNLLGTREPAVYGSATLADVEKLCRDAAAALGVDVEFRQSNHEGVLVDWIQQLGRDVKTGSSIGAVYNPGAHSHYSYALHDAIEAAAVPVIEVHISNIHAREEFRRHSVISPVASGIVVGFGVLGYPLAISGLFRLWQSEQSRSAAPPA
jgi:3-dehydroquinate dehydratase-2